MPKHETTKEAGQQTRMLADELPEPPQHDVGADIPFGQDAQFSGEVPAEVWDSVPDEDIPIKKGVYHFRLKEYKKGYTNDLPDPSTGVMGPNPAKPTYRLTWVCQEEPWTGRVVFDNRMTWACLQDILDANNASSPRVMEARKEVKSRLFWPRKFMKAIGCDLKTFGNSFDNFLATNPECRIRVKESERQTKELKDGKVQYVGTGKFTNNDIEEYLPLSGRPTR